DTSESFQAHDTRALRLGMGNDLTRELMVGVAHPPGLFALALAQRVDLPGFLKVLAPRVELAAFRALGSASAHEARALANPRHHGGHRHAHVYSPDALRRCQLRRRQGVRPIGHPLAPLALAAEHARLAQRLR